MLTSHMWLEAIYFSASYNMFCITESSIGWHWFRAWILETNSLDPGPISTTYELPGHKQISLPI